MALIAEAGLVNDAVDGVAAAMEVYIEALTAGDQFQIRFCSAALPWTLDSASIADDSAFRGHKHILTANFGVANPAAIPLSVGGTPLYWKLTNTADDFDD